MCLGRWGRWEWGPEQEKAEGRGRSWKGCDGRGAAGWRAEPKVGRVPPLRSPPTSAPPRRGICCPRASTSRGRAALGLLDLRFVVSPRRSHTKRSHLHPESPTNSPFQADCRHYSLRTHLRPPQALSGRSLAGPGKTGSGVPTAGMPTRVQGLGLRGEGTPDPAPSPTRGERREAEG